MTRRYAVKSWDLSKKKTAQEIEDWMNTESEDKFLFDVINNDSKILIIMGAPRTRRKNPLRKSRRAPKKAPAKKKK